jgi:predicted permease
VLRTIQERLRSVPGIEAVTFSQLGLFGGQFSTAAIEVSESSSPAGGGRDSALDRVGAGYFTTLRIPILRGRDILDSDRADTYRVCIVNEAFVREHFREHEPLGGQVTTVDDGVRVTYQVVGVVGDAHTQAIRDDVPPRFFVPAEQRPSSLASRTFLIRTAAQSPGMGASIRSAVNDADAAVSLANLATIEEQMASLTAEERSVARLALLFGGAALTLAAIGLYGVLAYGIGRRASEIAIRMALGAERQGIVVMILRETTGLVMAGVMAGGVLAFAASRLIANRLFGVAPHDWLNLVLAAGVLLVVALLASYIPAHRASRIDPMAALHEG